MNTLAKRTLTTNTWRILSAFRRFYEVLHYICRNIRYIPVEEFRVIQPSAALAPYVKNYWLLKTDGDSDVARTVPTGMMNMIFHRGRRLITKIGERLDGDEPRGTEIANEMN